MAKLVEKEIGEARGIQIGIAITRTEERKNNARKKISIARTLKQHGVSVELIMKATRLSKKVIESL